MEKTYLATAFLIFFASILNLAVTSVQGLSQATIMPNHTGYLDPTTIPITYHVVGEINNTGTASLKWLRVTAIFYDQSNSLMGSNSSYAFLDVLLPARKTPFEVIWIGESANQIYKYSLTLESNEYAGERQPALQIPTNSTHLDQAGFLKINGTVKNLGASNATYVKVAATLYQAEGKVVGTAFGYTMPSTIMPDSTALFELELRRKGVTFTYYSLAAESEEYAVVPELFPFHPHILLIISTLTTIFALLKKHRTTQRDTREFQKV